MLSCPVFQLSSPVELNQKISVVDYYDGKLFVGDEAGGVQKYSVNFQNPNLISSKPDAVNSKLFKGKVTAIKHLGYLNQLLVQGEKQLVVLETENLNKVSEIVGSKDKDCEFFVVDEDPRITEKTLARFLVCKNDFKFYFYEYEKSGFTVKGEIKVLFKPSVVAWFGKNIFVGFEKKAYQVISYEDKKLRDIEGFKDLQLTKHMIKIISEEETLLLAQADCFIPINTSTCDKLFKAPVQAPSKITGITVLHPYIVVLSESKVSVYNKIEVKGRQRLLQEINFEVSGSNVGRAISTSSDKIFFVTQSKAYYLKNIPYEQQIAKCLMEGKVEDGFMILDQYVGEDDQDRSKKYDQLKIDAAWIYIKDLKFAEAEQTLKELNYDVKEILGLYLNYVPNKPFFDVKGKTIPTISLLIDESKKRATADDLKKDPNKAIRFARDFLARILENRRKFLLDNYKNLKEKPTFLTSENYSPFKDEIKGNKVFSYTVEELLEIIDYAFLRVNIDLQKEAELSSFLQKKLYCKDYYKELEQYFCNDPKPSESIQAKFYEQFGKYKDALSVWEKPLHSTEKAKTDAACSEIIRIITTHTAAFKDLKERQIMFDYLKTVFLQNKTYAKQFFSGIDEKIISPDSIDKFLSNELKEISSLRETFLEVLVNEKKIEDERFHTQLGMYYVKGIFTERDKDQQPPAKNTNLGPKINELLKKFASLLRDPSARYNPEQILYAIKDSWLLDDEIFLYGKTKNHTDALNKLIKLATEKSGFDKLMFDKAEKYCAEKQERLLTKLFELYIKKLNDTKDPDDKKRLENVIQVFLKKYAAHPQLDPAEVIEKIPDEWSLQDKDNGVYSFLFYALSYTLHNKRNSKVAKYISEMDNLNTGYKLYKAQSSYVTIAHNRKCDICKKPIGKTVFVVYPNGVVAHHTCSQDKLSICPVTKQNFEKTFSG